MWLPVDFRSEFEADDPSRKRIKIGSVFKLWCEMGKLNKATWQASDESIRQWREQEFEPDRFESMARCGFSIWFCLAEYAVNHRLLIRLDY